MRAGSLAYKNSLAKSANGTSGWGRQIPDDASQAKCVAYDPTVIGTAIALAISA